MQHQQQTRSFAFKLAEQRSKDAKPSQAWKVRDGVSLAGCSVRDIEEPVFRVTRPFSFDDDGDYC